MSGSTSSTPDFEEDSTGSSNKARRAEFVEGIPFGVWVCDAEGGLEYASESFLELVGMSMEEATGFGWTKRLITENNDSLERWKACVKSECDWDDEHRIRDSDGEIRTLLARGHAIRNKAGKVTQWVGVHLDITRRKREEERLRMINLIQGRQQERERISQRLHDHLQQLLIGASFQLTSWKEIEENPEHVAALDHINEIVLEALNASRNLAKELNPPVLYDQGLGAALEWLAEFIHQTNHLEVQIQNEIKVEPEQMELRVVVFDAVRELLLNVVKHAAVDRATVICQANRKKIQIEVIDEGRGFDHQEDETEAAQAGLGLTGIRRRIESLSGICTVDSKPNDGTRVRVQLPIHPSEHS